MYMHGRCVIPVNRFWHKRGNFSAMPYLHFDQILDSSYGVCHWNHLIMLYVDFALSSSGNLMMMRLYIYTEIMMYVIANVFSYSIQSIPWFCCVVSILEVY